MGHHTTPSLGKSARNTQGAAAALATHHKRAQLVANVLRSIDHIQLLVREYVCVYIAAWLGERKYPWGAPHGQAHIDVAKR